MGFIKEPEGIDFVINSGILTDSDRMEISRFIEENKLNLAASNQSKRKSKIQKNRMSYESAPSIPLL
jgi:hypothetical protein